MKKKTPLMKIIYTGFILCLLASFVLVGCGEPEPTKTSPATTTPATTTPAKTTTPTTAPITTEAIKRGGVLKVAMAMDAMILGDPYETKQVGAIMQRAALEYLARFDSDGMLQPWLAESWTEDPDNLTFTVKLKEGIKFHDGSDLTAEVVKWNWERFIEKGSGYTQSVSSIEAVGDYTVVVHLSSWNNALPYNMCFWAGAVASKAAWEANGGEDWGALNPVGTGPFKFVSWEPDSLIVYEKFDGYWQEDKPYLDGIEFHIIADEATRTASFKAGEVDMINQATTVQTHTLAQEGKYVIVDLKNGIGTGIAFLTFDAGNPDSVFADLKVRQAVAHAIDRETIVETTFYGFAVPTNQYGASDNWGYNPNLTTYPYNPDRARELLAEAGHPHIETMITILSDETQFTAIAGMLAEVGIDATVNLVPGGAWFQAATQGWEGILGTPSPPDGDVSTRFGFSTTTSMFCVSQIKNEENDALVKEMTSAGTFEEKKALTQAYQERIWGELVSNIALWIMDNMAVKYPYVQDDGFCVTDGHGWTPEDVWLDK